MTDSATKSQPKILIIEDDKDWQRLLTKYLDQEIYLVTIAGGYSSAVEQLDKTDYDLIILDLCLVEDGAEYYGMSLLSLLQESKHEVPVIVVSAYGTVSRVRDGFKLYNIYDFISKRDFSPREYQRIVSDAIRKQMRNRIFFCYSHEDSQWLDRFLTMLKPLERQKKIVVWSDREIEMGDKWKSEIENALSLAKVAILLVSPNFLASDFIAEHELPPILDAASNDGVRVIWVAVSAGMYRETEINHYQAANDPTRPLDSLSKSQLNKKLVDICEKVLAMT